MLFIIVIALVALVCVSWLFNDFTKDVTTLTNDLKAYTEKRDAARAASPPDTSRKPLSLGTTNQVLFGVFCILFTITCIVVLVTP